MGSELAYPVLVGGIVAYQPTERVNTFYRHLVLSAEFFKEQQLVT